VKRERRKRPSARPPVVAGAGEASLPAAAGLSRREFARTATVAAAAIAASPASVLDTAAGLSLGSGVTTHGSIAPHAGGSLPREAGAEKSKLSAESLAEVEAKVAEILRRYGSKLTEEQKSDVRRLVREAQPSLEALRAFPLENRDEPAAILHLVSPYAAPRAAVADSSQAKKPAGEGV